MCIHYDTVNDFIAFGTRRKDTVSQRRILRSYGAKYRYQSGEAVERGIGRLYTRLNS